MTNQDDQNLEKEPERIPQEEGEVKKPEIEAYFGKLAEKLGEKALKAEKPITGPAPKTIPKKEEKKEENKEITASPHETEFKAITGHDIKTITGDKKIIDMADAEKEKTVKKLEKFPPHPEEVGKQAVKEPILEEIIEERKKS